jgi:precorrin-2 dehydrogenase/sirohydrochlorin ferrochelatase
MDAFPAFFPLSGRTVVIAGEGEGAEAKIRLFEGSPATIRRLTGDDARNAISYQGATLAFVASRDDGFALAAVTAARAAHVPVNAVDRPDLCDFTTPAVIDRGEVVAAVGTAGASPMLATLLRHDIETRVPEGAGRVAALFRNLQNEVRDALPEAHRRRAFLRAALTGPAAQAALTGDMDAAVRRLREALARGEQGLGVVQLLDARGPAELLTLKASRALAEADVLVCDTGVDPNIVALARRDAERMAPEAVSAQRLHALVEEGKRVVRLTAGHVPAEELAEAGVTVEILPAASLD